MPSLIKPAKFFLGLSGGLVFISLIFFFIYPGPKLAIDFTGGTLLELRPDSEMAKETIVSSLSSLAFDPPLGNIYASKTVEGTVFLRMRDISNEEHLALLTHLTHELGNITELQFTTIGPTVGASLKKRAVIALLVASVAIVLYLAFAFRKVPRKLNPWKFGVIAVVTLLHDIIVVVGIFVLISHSTHFEFDTLFVTALLTILGYSVNDTIVIFDRIRENIFNKVHSQSFEDVAEQGLRESITRSIHTSVSTLIMLSSLFFLGSESIRWFVLALMVGTVIGTYSSLFLATPLLLYWRRK